MSDGSKEPEKMETKAIVTPVNHNLKRSLHLPTLTARTPKDVKMPPKKGRQDKNLI